MRVLYVNSTIYDFLTATIIEGLNELSQEAPIQLVTTAASNYSRFWQVWPRQKIYREKRSFDLVILGTNVGVDLGLFWDVARSGRTICIDGADTPEFIYAASDFTLYFKRELYRIAFDNIRPCPFAIERRWWSALSSDIRHLLAACFGPTTTERAQTLQFLKQLGWPSLKIGGVPMKRYQSLCGVLLGQCSLSTWRRFRFSVGHNSAYYKILRSSLVSLSVPGAGIDTGRYWEILGSGAALACPKNKLQIPNALVPGQHHFEYASLDELREVVSRAQTERKPIEAMRARAREHCLRYHTTKARARYVIQAFNECRV